MIIRCDRCSTVYELDEGLLAPEGSPVQCSRCANVFTARPTRIAGQTLQGVPPPAEAAPAAPAASEVPRSALRPTPARSAPAVYRPAPPPGPAHVPVTRAPTLRRDTVGTIESRLRRSARWRWLAPVVVVAVAAAAVAGWYGLRRPPEPTGRAARAEALALAGRDDAASLQQAAAKLEAVARSAAQPEAAQADRALVELLLADPGPKPARRGADELASALARAREALSQGDAVARAPGEVARARAVAAALEGNRDEVRRQATAARALLAGDAWADLAEIWVEARAPDRAVRDRAVSTLGGFVERHPELLRARYVLAQALAAAGRRTDAVAAADALLARNPAHERAAALKAELSRPPPQAPVASPTRVVPPVAPPAPTSVAAERAPAGEEKRDALPRKPVAQPAQAAGTPPPAASPGEAAPSEPRRSGEPPGAASPAEAGAAPPSQEAGAEAPSGAALPSRLRPAAVPQPEPVLSGE